MAFADEQLPVLKVGGDVYSNVTVTSVSATHIHFTYSGGMGSVKLKDLDPELQQHFSHDAAKAKVVSEKLYGTNAPAPAAAPDLSDPKAAMDDAMARVRGIVNQPVTHLTVTPGMSVFVITPGWFHPGAITPDFNTVDIRTTQDTKYAEHEYVSSDLNPGVCFHGSELEFNSMTKYFYTDRTVPKKKLTESEMLEINRLYRIIGQCQEKLNNPGGVRQALNLHLNWIITGAAALLLVAMALLNARKSQTTT